MLWTDPVMCFLLIHYLWLTFLSLSGRVQGQLSCSDCKLWISILCVYPVPLERLVFCYCLANTEGTFSVQRRNYLHLSLSKINVKMLFIFVFKWFSWLTLFSHHSSFKLFCKPSWQRRCSVSTCRVTGKNKTSSICRSEWCISQNDTMCLCSKMEMERICIQWRYTQYHSIVLFIQQKPAALSLYNVIIHYPGLNKDFFSSYSDIWVQTQQSLLTALLVHLGRRWLQL